MRIFKLTPIILALLSITLLVPAPATAGNDIAIYLDGVKLDNIDSPQIINGRVLVPMRGIFESFSLNVQWNQENQTIDTYAGPQMIRLQVGNNSALYKTIDSNSWNERQIDQPPVLINNRTYVPVRFIAETLNCIVDWDNNLKKVDIYRPFVYKDGEWYKTRALYWNPDNPDTGSREYAKIGGEWQGILKTDGLTFACLDVGDSPIMSHSCLYILSGSGRSRLLATAGDSILSVKLDGDSCYVLESRRLYWAFSIVKIPLNDPYNQMTLGNEGFSYGMKIKVKENAESFNLESTMDDAFLQIRDGGVYTIGYRADLAGMYGYIEGANRYRILSQLEESYGYYLLPKDGSLHQFQGNEMLEKG